MAGDPLVSAAWLAGELAKPDLKIVDATWFMPGELREGREEYRRAHIPGAVFFDIDAVSDHATDLPHVMLPDPQALAAGLGTLGLKRSDRVVAYDAQGIFSAPRAWWTLRVAGFADVFVLDGGLKAWIADGGVVETGEPAIVSSVIEPQFDAELVRGLQAVRAIVERGGAQLVDARAGPRFRGEAPEPRPGLRSGHMPGARNVPWQQLIGPDGRMRGAAALRAAFETAGVDLGAPIVTTCGSGVSAALLAFGLARLGLDRVAVYDGSWTEWGGLADTPVVTGA